MKKIRDNEIFFKTGRITNSITLSSNVFEKITISYYTQISLFDRQQHFERSLMYRSSLNIKVKLIVIFGKKLSIISRDINFKKHGRFGRT